MPTDEYKEQRFKFEALSDLKAKHQEGCSHLTDALSVELSTLYRDRLLKDKNTISGEISDVNNIYGIYMLSQRNKAQKVKINHLMIQVESNKGLLTEQTKKLEEQKNSSSKIIANLNSDLQNLKKDFQKLHGLL